MIRKSPAPALLALLPAIALGQDAANQALRAEVANKVTAARQANATAMQQYTWDQRTELLEDGTVKDTRVQMVNWVNGQYQKSLVSNEGPSLPRFGIRKRIAEEKQKEMQQYMSGLKGAARGAAGGALIGGIAGDAGKGAAIGAASGAVAGRSRGRQQQQAAEQQVAQQSAQAQQATAQQLDNFKKAFSVCLEAKKYMVKY